MSLVIAGERSGVGKTTITLSLLSYLIHKGYKVQSFKVGPDYIDPMFHTYVTGKYCRNLDPILTSSDYLKSCFNYFAQTAEYSLIEGVMGLFDGIPFQGYQSFASTAHIAKILDLPVLLVLDCSKISTSLAAIASGFRQYDPHLTIAGVILNRVGSSRHLNLLESAFSSLNMPILGVFYRDMDITIPARHLGLIPTGEISTLNQIIDKLAAIGKTAFNWEKLLPLLKVEKKAVKPLFDNNFAITKKIKIAVALDEAFNFYYQDNLDILKYLGAELIFWSPLKDQKIPENVQGFYFGGGFPEVFAAELSANISVKKMLLKTLQSGIPTLAECGGLMYLCQGVRDFQDNEYSMVGIFPNITQMEKRLTLGYRQGKSLVNTPFFKQGETIFGHEFHRSNLINFTPDSTHNHLLEIKPLYGEQKISLAGLTKGNIYASYLHIHFGQNLKFATGFFQ